MGGLSQPHEWLPDLVVYCHPPEDQKVNSCGVAAPTAETALKSPPEEAEEKWKIRRDALLVLLTYPE